MTDLALRMVNVRWKSRRSRGAHHRAACCCLPRERVYLTFVERPALAHIWQLDWTRLHIRRFSSFGWLLYKLHEGEGEGARDERNSVPDLWSAMKRDYKMGSVD